MRQALLFCLFLVVIGGVSAQTASFYANDERQRKMSHQDEGMKRLEWVIDGKVMHFGDPPIEVIPDSTRLDTIYFKDYRPNATYDTLICNIATPTAYEFIFNDCCGGFNVRIKGAKRDLVGKLAVSMTKSRKSTQYLATLGEAGTLLKPGASTEVKRGCRSAMSPNIYWVFLRQIEQCEMETEGAAGCCWWKEGATEPQYEFSFIPQKTYLKFLYLPLSAKPLPIYFDARKETVSFFK